jgi:penicillin-binding protein 1C
MSRRATRFGVAMLLTTLFAILSAGVVLDRIFPPDLAKYQHPALLVLATDGRPVAAFGSVDHYWRLPTAPQNVDPLFIKTLISTEDKRFWLTPGIDPIALTRAAIEDARSGRIVSGGSSITMQVARLLTPHPHTAGGKILEILRALQLSAHYSKPQILAMYLTLAPYGGNIEGVQAASWLYFGHGAGHLSMPEIALLVALPRRPEALRPDRHPEAAVQAMDRIYAEQDLGPPPVLLADAITRIPFPSAAPYLAQHLWAEGERGIIHSSIDAALQKQITQLATTAAVRAGGGTDIAILLIRNSDATIAAYVGGSGSGAPGGYVDMIQAIRSPGSTLKPFIYGMAFDRNLATPATLIDDTPLANASYDPSNFDRSWHGIIPVTVALQQSYNLPAVKMLQAIGPLALVSALRSAGMEMQLPASDDHPSLAIALGGVGVRLNDLAALYAGLAEGNTQFRLRLTLADPAIPQAPVMTGQSAQLILSILEGLPPPDGTAGFGGRAVAYKTGTSYGFRDAWSIGVSGDWTVGVWVGRPDGTPRPGAFGLNTAAPIMADVFAMLPPDQNAMPIPTLAIEPSAASTPSLMHFDANENTAASPQIVFPPPDAAIELDPGTPVALQATGGTTPYRWIVDGTELLPPPIGESFSWQPASPGFFRITVIDQQNQTCTETVQVR